MRFHIVTIFPNMFESYFAESIISRAISSGKIEINTYALREYTTDKHRRVDGRPYGGGPGMVMWAEPIMNCVDEIKEKQKAVGRKQKANLKSKILHSTKVTRSAQNFKFQISNLKFKTIIFSPGGKDFDNVIAKKMVAKKGGYTDIIFICGRYEGVDARVKKILKAEEWSIGPYVLTGGELPAMVCIDCITRQIEGVLHDENSLEETRTASHEMYARPEIFEYSGKKYKVPKVLLSGNHKLIDEYRAKKENKIGKIK